MTKAPDAHLSQVKWRVDGKPNAAKNACRYVPYLDATTVAEMLDEWAVLWRDEYEPVVLDGKPALFCHLSLIHEKAPEVWVTRTDVGVASNFEAQKGMVSDAFKRCATIKWGVGRNVYKLPTLWAPCRVDERGNAWPTDDTLPEIVKKLKAAGFHDAEAAEATAEHDEPVSQPSQVSQAAPQAPEKTELAKARDELAAEIKNLSAEDQARLRDWAKSSGLPAFGLMEEGDIDAVYEHLAEMRERPYTENEAAEALINMGDRPGVLVDAPPASPEHVSKTVEEAREHLKTKTRSSK